jgi:hypothetical protein
MDISDKLTSTKPVFSKPAPSAATVSDSSKQSKARTTGYGVTPTVYNYGVSQASTKWIAGGTGTNIFAVSYDGARWFSATSPQLSGVSSINCIANNGALWVIGTTNSDSSGSLFYSSDGASWTSSYTTAYPITKLRYNGELFVAFNSNGDAFYSYYGANWLTGNISYYTRPTEIFHNGELGWNGVYWLCVSNGAADASGNRLWKSYDGITWLAEVGSNITSTIIYTVYWTGSFWFLSGKNNGNYFNAIRSEFDATSWSTNASPQNIASICHNGKIFVASGDLSSNAILWSYDAVNWTAVSQTVFAIANVKWMGDRFVAVGTTTQIATSKDGIRWTVLPNIPNMSGVSCLETDAHAIHKIQFPENVVFGGNAYSRDGGATWSVNSVLSSAAKTVAFNGKQYIFANLANGNSYVSEYVRGRNLTKINIGDLSANTIQWNGSYWLMGGTKSYLLKSADGFNWSKIQLSGGFVCNGLAWSGARWVASGAVSATPALLYSSDGVNWLASSSSSVGGGAVEWNGSYFLCGGLTNTSSCISSDGKTWSSRTIGSNGAITGIAWSGKSWVVVTAPSSLSTPGILYSSDGFNWTATTTTGYSYTAVVWAGTNFVAVTSGGNALYSYDGQNWQVGTGSGSFGSNLSWTRPDCATFRTKQPTIVGGTGTQNTLLYSADGVTYRGLGNSVLTTSCRTVAWNGDIWVAGGEGANTLAYSYDGKTWTGLGYSVFSSGCYKVVSNGTVWVAMGAGTNTIATSTDGMNWFGLGTSLFDGNGVGVDWNGSQWLAVGNGSTNTLAISSDPMAQTWTPLGTSVFSSGMRCVKWMLGAWFVGADASTIASSPDGTTWTQTSTSLNSSCRSISWNGREAFATGSGTETLITSTDGVTWSAVSTSGITGGYGVEWNGTTWIITGSGTSTINTAVGSVLSNLLTQGYCVGANSGVGAMVFNNRVYLNAGERLVVYGPEYYDGSLMSDTSISMNMNLPV